MGPLPPPLIEARPPPPSPPSLPGIEKREKMAVMEAAISSTLAHPNIVATYTYSIKPVRDTTHAADKVWMGKGVEGRQGVNRGGGRCRQRRYEQGAANHV